MRKKINLLGLLILLLLVLTSCSISEGDIKEKISAPKTIDPPIEGKWKISKKLGSSNDSIDQKDTNIGSEGLFRNEAIIFGKEYTSNPSFRLKNVKISDYLLYKYKKDYRDLGIEDQEVKVITVLNDNQYFFDLIKLKNNEMIVYKDDNFYTMEKIAKEVSLNEIERYIEIEKSMVQSLDNLDKADLKTGVLLGIKTPKYDEENDISTWEYKTLWINTNDGEVSHIYEAEDLLIPRKNGFWTVGVEREESEGLIQDKISAKPLVKSSEEDLEENIRGSLDLYNREIFKDNSVLKHIVFLSNDYMSIEKIDYSENERRTLETLGLDNIGDNRPIKLSDIIGEEGKKAFMEGAESAIDISEAARLNERNIALRRRDGYWIFKGRVNYIEKEKELFKDFNIKAIPPEEIVKYDKLSIPWSLLEAKIPSIIDVFSSPNEEFIIVQTENDLRIYETEKGDLLDNQPIEVIDISINSSIVMAEWATGRYTNLWETEVINNNGIKIK